MHSTGVKCYILAFLKRRWIRICKIAYKNNVDAVEDESAALWQLRLFEAANKCWQNVNCCLYKIWNQIAR